MLFFDSHKEIALGSRLNTVSDYLMRQVQLVYDHENLDFDPYLFPVFKIIIKEKQTTITTIFNQLPQTQPAITQAIHKLNAKKLIKISPNKIDKRKKDIKLSNEGKLLVQTITPVWKVIEEEIKKITTHNSNTLIEHLDILEEKLSQMALSDIIINRIKMKKEKEVTIVPFESQYANDFKELNIQWLKEYFVVEPHDADLLGRCEETIIKPGGHIFLAKLGNNVVGCFSLIKFGSNSFELGKMAVAPEYQGLRIGQKLMNFCIDFAKEKQLDSLVLYSNRKLRNAIHIYKKYGFNEIPLEENPPYLRSNIKMELAL